MIEVIRKRLTISANRESTVSGAIWRITAKLAGGAIALTFGVLLTANLADAATCAVGSSETYTTIQAAVADTNCTTIDVDAGNYSGTVTVNRALMLNGANAGVIPNTGTRGAESIISGAPSILIDAPNAFVDGFTINGPSSEPSSGYGITVKDNGAVIKNNIISGIVGTTGTAQAVSVYRGPDGVVLADNLIEDVSSPNSTKGVFIEDSVSADPSIGVSVKDNSIKNIHSDDRGAHGILLNNGNANTPNAYLLIDNNNISGLRSDNGWVHAIGIEANAPNVAVTGNSFGDLDANGNPDDIAVWFEGEGSSYATSKVNRNSFDFTSDSGVLGIAVGFSSGDSVDGTCNYWGSATGPSGAGLRKGALVGPLVTFSPWEKTANGSCSPKEAGHN
jgi:hypothetical protein